MKDISESRQKWKSWNNTENLKDKRRTGVTNADGTRQSGHSLANKNIKSIIKKNHKHAGSQSAKTITKNLTGSRDLLGRIQKIFHSYEYFGRFSFRVAQLSVIA